jgi:hypothetical protein
MPNVVAMPFGLLLVLFVFSGLVAGRAGPAFGADIQESPAAKLRMSQDSSRGCTERCMSQCRAALSACSSGGAKDTCRAEFQICARRCVVSCGSR